jgi:hypothetical protein
VARWERLFADLEAQAAAADAAEVAGEVAERTRMEVAALRLVDRLRAATGHPVRLSCLGGEQVAGTLARTGADWVLVAERSDRDALVPVAAVTGVAGLGAVSATPGSEGRVGARLGIGYALRGVARDRSAAAVSLVDETRIVGTVDRVGADFVEIAEHPAGEARRARVVSQVRTIPISALAVVRTT